MEEGFAGRALDSDCIVWTLYRVMCSVLYTLLVSNMDFCS